ncbi:MAG: efflux RND transporter periplasmic adaptor subunit [Desulfobacteraceae bacterium]|nr:efflux RND transporter periplasmic adaptor subunit [Desulfobacteraceae bacterium]
MGRLIQWITAAALLLFIPAAGMSETVTAVRTTVMETWPAVGTVRPRSETKIQAQTQAQVKAVHVKAGDAVTPGDLLVTLDSRQPLSNLDRAGQGLKAATAARQKARQGIESARAAHTEAKLNFQRIKGYLDANAATRQELETAESNFIQAKAALSMAKEALKEADSGIKQAKEVVKQARVALGFTRVTAPVKGEVIQRLVEPGDLALPGKPLVMLRTETGFRIEAHVREGLVSRVAPGTRLTAEIPTLDTACRAVVEEIVPYADPDTRTFLVKAAIDPLEGLYPGMYAKLMIPAAQKEVVLIPRSCVIRTGQLELVRVRTDHGWELRYVTTGKETGDKIEVLSGVAPGEVLGIGETGETGEEK